MTLSVVLDAAAFDVIDTVEGAIVITSDPDDINALATALPGTRVTPRTPRAIATR